MPTLSAHLRDRGRAYLSLRSLGTLKPEYINVQHFCMEFRLNLW